MLHSLLHVHGKKFVADAALRGGAVAFSEGELCDYAFGTFGYAAFPLWVSSWPFLGAVCSRATRKKQGQHAPPPLPTRFTRTGAGGVSAVVTALVSDLSTLFGGSN